MAKEELEIEITADGKVTLRTIGIKGPRCIDVAEALALIVGHQEEPSLTSEFYEVETDINNEQRIDQRYM